MNSSSDHATSEKRVRDPEDDNELWIIQAALEKKKAELTVQIAKYGLDGVLAGAVGGFLTVIGIAIAGVVSPSLNITGPHLTVMMAIIGATVAIFGAFIFNRSVSIVALIGEHKFEAATKNQASPEEKPKEK